MLVSRVSAHSTRAMPKSSSLTRSARSRRAGLAFARKMLLGLTSRWMTPAACTAPSASQTCRRDGKQIAAGARRDPRLQPRGQRFAVEVLHDQVRGAVGQVVVLEHLDHVRVPGEAERLGFAPQAVGGHGVVGDRGAQQLDGHRHVVGEARGLVDDAARARAELRAEPVACPPTTDPSKKPIAGSLALLFQA